MTNGPVNAHLISGPCRSTKHTQPEKKNKVKKLLWPSILTYLHLLNKLTTSTIFRLLAAIIFEISTVFPFSYSKAYITKFDIPVKYVKVTPGSSFEKKTMMGRSPQCYNPSFVKIGLRVPVKKIFQGSLPYIGLEAILVMWPAPYQQMFISMNLKAYILTYLNWA